MLIWAGAERPRKTTPSLDSQPTSQVTWGGMPKDLFRNLRESLPALDIDCLSKGKPKCLLLPILISFTKLDSPVQKIPNLFTERAGDKPRIASTV